MNVFVLDASVTMRWCFEDGKHSYADNILEQLKSGGAVVPTLWRYEVSAVLAKAQKSGVITASKAAGLLDTLSGLRIILDQEGVNRIFDAVHRLATTHGLSSYDASCLELVVRRNLPLATLDDQLIRACKALHHPLL